MDLMLQSERLILRPLRQDDAGAIQVQCNNWNVARMTARIPHPYPDGLAERWIAEHDETRARGTDFPSASSTEATLIGVVGLDREDSGPFELGYWIGEPWWGQGFATEAAKRAAAFAFDDLGTEELISGHFLDNPASGRVLTTAASATAATRRYGARRAGKRSRRATFSCGATGSRNRLPDNEVSRRSQDLRQSRRRRPRRDVLFGARSTSNSAARTAATAGAAETSWSRRSRVSIP